MLPTKKEQEEKYKELKSLYNSNEGICNDIMNEDSKFIAQKYAKWYATEVIKHCAEVATTRTNDESTSIIVDKQSILNVINELQ